MSSDSLRPILEGLSRDLNDLTAAHAFSVIGLRRIPEYFAALPKYPENPDPVVLIGTGPPDSPDTPPYAGWRLSEALTQVKQNGPVEIRLGHQWIVFLYELWEHESGHGSRRLTAGWLMMRSMICWATCDTCVMMWSIIVGLPRLETRAAVFCSATGFSPARS